MTSNLKNKVVIALCTFGVIILTASALVWTQQQNNSTSLPTSDANPSDNEAKQEKQSQNFVKAVWLPDWASNQALQSLEQNGDSLTNLSPVWYDAQPDGSLKNLTPRNARDTLRLASEKGLEITPSVALFDYTILTEILQNQTNFNRHVEALVSIANQDGVDGVDLDYESTQLSDKEKYFDLLRVLSERLKAINKKLVVTVLPKWGDEIVYLSLKETRQVQDWTRISEYADEIRIMAYDYTSSGSSYAGPVAPLDWQEQVVKYALSKIPKEKTVLGIPLYGYEKFTEVNNSNKAGNFFDPKLIYETSWERNLGEPNPGRAYSYEMVKKALETENGYMEDWQGEKIWRYTKENTTTGKLENRILGFIDPEGIKARVELAKKYELAGVAFWRLGEEGELLEEI